jgi:hypothetical protein
MSDSVELLNTCYFYNDILDQFGDTLDYLVPVIDDPRWIWKIKYHKGLWYCFYKDDNEAAKKLLEKLDYKRTDDLEALSLYYQLFADDLGFLTRIEILERLCESEQEDWKLQYRTNKGIALLLIGEKDKAVQEITNALNSYEALDEERRSTRGNDQFAEITCLLSNITRDKELGLKASGLYDELLSDVGNYKFANVRRAWLYFNKGQSLKEAWELGRAEEAYRTSMTFNEMPLVKLYLAEVMIFRGKID